MTKKTVSYSNLRLLSILGLICVLLAGLMVMSSCGDDEEEAAEYTLTIAVSPTGGGTTSPSAGTHTYDEGTVVTITATAATGYDFDKWSGASTATSATTTVTMTSNKTVTANFEEETPAVTEYTLTMAVTPAGGGTTTPAAGTSTHDEGDVVTVTADPDTCYEFDGWTPVAAVADATAASTTVTMDADKTVTANFSLITYTLTMAKVGNGTITPDVGDHTEDCGDVVDITATPAGDSKFVDWTGDVADADSASTTVTMDADQTVTANFALLQNVTLTMAVSGDGTVTPAAGDHTYLEGAVVDITAT
ncbi:MAG: hypothetical protein ISS52_07275, partial [Dehalococcoidia bacterium]|nr:hypothetical protein [Dehalococcoidia bacterium]